MDRIYSMLGLAMKAGQIKSGGFLTVESIRAGTARLVIIAADAQKNTSKKVTDKCNYYHVPFRVCGIKSELGGAIGRGDCACAAITDEGFAKSIMRLTESTGG